MAVANDAVIERWAHRVLTGEAMTDRHGRALSTEGRNLLSVGDTLFSYGRHFPLAIASRNARGKVTHFVLNGDRYSVTTSRHQGMTRRLCGRLAHQLGDVPVIILPFSALAAAGVDPNDIEPIDVRDDRNVTERHSSRERPGTRLALADCPSGRATVEMVWHHGVIVDRETDACYVRSDDAWTEWPANAQALEDAIHHDTQPFPDRPPAIVDWDECEWYRRYAHGSRRLPVRKPVRVPDPNRVYVGRSSWNIATRDDDGVWRWATQRHFLGDSLLRARVREFVSVRPTSEQIAAHGAWRRAAARYHEARERVRAEHHIAKRWSRCSNVPRSSDMLEQLDTRTRTLWDEAERAHEALAALIPAGQTYDRGARTLHITRRRTRRPFLLSSFDYQEATPLYFLCELPAHARPSTVQEAIDALRPPEVVAAEARGLKVTRQGDLFAIPVRLNRRQIRRMLTRRPNPIGKPSPHFERGMRVLGTNHTVTEGAVCKGGAVLGRGVMRHEPGRRADHARKRMGDGRTWHLLVRNTVPRQ